LCDRAAERACTWAFDIAILAPILAWCAKKT
jgi:hypothetical protein